LYSANTVVNTVCVNNDKHNVHLKDSALPAFRLLYIVVVLGYVGYLRKQLFNCLSLPVLFDACSYMFTV